MMKPEEDHAQASTDMESPVPDLSPLPYPSNSDYRSVMRGSTPVEGSHPLSSLQHEDDQFEEIRTGFFPKSSNDSIAKPREDPFVEPASYADATFTPYTHLDSLGNGSSKESGTHLPLLSSSSSLFSEYLTITVSQPQKVQDSTGSSIVPGSNTYVTYLIVTCTDIPKYGGNEFAVRRRFRDVVTLADRLAEAYRGYFIPARPDKCIVESQVMQKQEFIEQRRIALEKYLFRLANHPVIRFSDELRMFLQSQGKLPLMPTTDIASRMLDGAVNLPYQLLGEGSTVMMPEDVIQPAKGGRDLVRLFKELRQSVTVEWGGVKPSVNEEDNGFLERKGKLEDLELKLSEASQQAEALIKAQHDVGETMGELGLATIKLAKFETEEATYNAQRTHATDVRRVATAAVKASRFYRESNAQAVRHLDQLHEYLSWMQSVHTAFNDRSNALLTVQTLHTEVASINARIEKLTIASLKVFGGDKSRNHKIEELKEALKTTEDARDTAAREYERMKGINQIEIDHFESVRQRDFWEMLIGFVHNQIGYAEKIATVWTKMTEDININGQVFESPILGMSKTF